jgi:hypothetical protein
VQRRVEDGEVEAAFAERQGVEGCDDTAEAVARPLEIRLGCPEPVNVVFAQVDGDGDRTGACRAPAQPAVPGAQIEKAHRPREATGNRDEHASDKGLERARANGPLPHERT